MNRVRLDLFQNKDYDPGPFMKRALWYACSKLFVDTGLPWPRGMVRLLLRIFGARIGKGVVIKPSVRIKYPWKLTIGDWSWIGENAWIDNLEQVTIGHHCCISQGALLLCGNHDYKSPTFNLIARPIVMKDGSWAGANSLLGPGCVLGTEAVLTAGSVGLGVMEAQMIHQGNPAAPIRSRVIEP